MARCFPLRQIEILDFYSSAVYSCLEIIYEEKMQHSNEKKPSVILKTASFDAEYTFLQRSIQNTIFDCDS